MNLGRTILELRKAKNVTQEDMATELGVTAAAVSKWENGYTLPDILMLCAIADYFHVTTDALLGRNTETKSAIIAAETYELGQKIAQVASEYGIINCGIYTDYQEALTNAENDKEVKYIIVGYHSGFYDEDTPIQKLVSVSHSDQQILEGLRYAFENFWTNGTAQDKMLHAQLLDFVKQHSVPKEILNNIQRKLQE